MTIDLTKCAYIDAWYDKSKRNFNFPSQDEKVYVVYNDENNIRQEIILDPVYECYIPNSHYFWKKEEYDKLLNENSKCLEGLENPESDDKKYYVSIDGVVCNKKIYPNYYSFNQDTNGVHIKKSYDRTGKKISSNEKEYGNIITRTMKELDIANSKREAEGKQSLKVKWFTYESTSNVTFKTVIRNFADKNGMMQTPKLKVSYFDIEVDVDMSKEFPTPDKAKYRINAVSFYNEWEDKLLTYALKPIREYDGIKPISIEEAIAIGNQFENTIVFDDEKDLLIAMADSIDKADVICGYNSEMFDLPYIINRIGRVFEDDVATTERILKKFCSFGKIPVIEEVMLRDGTRSKCWRLIGKVHLDYLKLYKRHKTKQQPSYKLDFIGELETKERKVPYDGTLEDLYHGDFKKFIEYNRQDVMLLKKIDNKVKFMELTNGLSHTVGVNLDTLSGTVSWVDQAIINEAHLEGKVCPDKLRTIEESDKEDMYREGLLKRPTERSIDDKEWNWDDTSPPGAWVSMPYKGLFRKIGSYDINSLYPSVIRSLNASIETVVARVKTNHTSEYMKQKILTGNNGRGIFEKVKDRIPDYAEAWNNEFNIKEFDMIRNKTEDLITLKLEAGGEIIDTAKNIYELIYVQHKDDWCISANGTIFTKLRKGIIPTVLEKWFAERKKFKKIMTQYEDCIEGIEIEDEKLLSELKNV